MKKQLTKEEQLINFLLNKYVGSKTNRVSISKNDIQTLNLTEQEIIHSIYYLDNYDLIDIKEKSVHDDLSRYWSVELLPACINYFQNKESNQKEQRRKLFNEIRAWITLIIAIVALIHSIYTTDSKSDSSQVSEPHSPSVSDNQVHIP